MAKWTIVYTGGQIGKDGYFCNELDLSWLPSTILAVQSLDGITCEIEHGDRATETHTHNEVDVPTSSLAWWSNVETSWQSAYDEAFPE